MDALQRVSSCQPALWSCSPASTSLFPHWCSAAYVGHQDGVQHVWLGPNIGAFVVTQPCCLWPSRIRGSRCWSVGVANVPLTCLSFSAGFDKTLYALIHHLDTHLLTVPSFSPATASAPSHRKAKNQNKKKKKNNAPDRMWPVAFVTFHLHAVVPECRRCQVRQKRLEKSSLEYLRLPGGRGVATFSAWAF